MPADGPHPAAGGATGGSAASNAAARALAAAETAHNATTILRAAALLDAAAATNAADCEAPLREVAARALARRSSDGTASGAWFWRDPRWSVGNIALTELRWVPSVNSSRRTSALSSRNSMGSVHSDFFELDEDTTAGRERILRRRSAMCGTMLPPNETDFPLVSGDGIAQGSGEAARWPPRR